MLHWSCALSGDDFMRGYQRLKHFRNAFNHKLISASILTQYVVDENNNKEISSNIHRRIKDQLARQSQTIGSMCLDNVQSTGHKIKSIIC